MSKNTQKVNSYYLLYDNTYTYILVKSDGFYIFKSLKLFIN